MKKINLFLGIALLSLFVMSCGSNKEVAQQNQPAKLPCPDCTATKGEFKYLAQAIAETEYDVQAARTFAAQTARDELQAMIESVVQRSVDQFTQQHRDGSDVKNIAKSTIQSVGVIKGKIKNTPVTCWDTQETKSGKTIVYCCVEFSTEEVYKTVVETMSADKELKIDFRQDQYKNDFYKALEEYNNN